MSNSSITYKIFYDPVQDAWNWWNSLNAYHQHKKLKTPAAKSLGQQVTGQTFAAARPAIITFLAEQDQSSLTEFRQIMEQQFAQYFHPAIRRLEQVTGHPLFIDDFMKWRRNSITPHSNVEIPTETLLFPITTFPCMVAFYAEGVYFTYAKIDHELWGMPLDGTLHELLHLQCQAYWRNDPNSPIFQLSDDDYYVLKESLTVILDEEWRPIITLPDCSYPEFQPLRDQLHAHWRQHHDFSALMDYGYQAVRDFTKSTS